MPRRINRQYLPGGAPEGAPRPAGEPPRPAGGVLTSRVASSEKLAPPTSGACADELVEQVRAKILAESEQRRDRAEVGQIRARIEEALDQVIATGHLMLSRGERQTCLEAIVSEILGYGPIDALLADDEVSEIMVNGPHIVYCERGGKLVKTDVRFRDDEHLMRIVERILQPIGRRCDESQPYVDARLPDGSRVNIIIPPLALDGPAITIRKFRRHPLQVEDLVRFGTLTPELATFLNGCIRGRLNTIISGGTGSGKTTLLNVLSSFIPEDDRIVTIEDAAELQLNQEHVVRLETRPPSVEGKGRVTIRDLVINALRMRPDRLVIGECRGGEALDMLQAMNTGHAGSLTTLHANTPREAVSRLETLVLMAGMDLPLKAVRDQIAKAIDLIVQLERLADGSRKVTCVTEVQGLEGDVVVMQDVFAYKQEGIDRQTGKIIGRLAPCGTRPKFAEKLETSGIHLPPDIFGARRY